jgi:protein-disulfide isomerase
MEETTNKNPYLIPISIVIAGIVIAGALIYKPSSNVGVKKSFDYVALAKELKLDTKAFKSCVENRTYKEEVLKDLADGQKAGVSGTPATFINGKLIEGAYPYEAYKESIEASLSGVKEVPSDPNLVMATIDDDTVLGDANAPVTMIVFGDFQCPYCGQAYQTGEKQVRDEYVKSGKVKMVYRDFPLINIHPSAIPAAEASECAKAQGKYWQYHDALFENQDKL